MQTSKQGFKLHLAALLISAFFQLDSLAASCEQNPSSARTGTFQQFSAAEAAYRSGTVPESAQSFAETTWLLDEVIPETHPRFRVSASDFKPVKAANTISIFPYRDFSSRNKSMSPSQVQHSGYPAYTVQFRKVQNPKEEYPSLIRTIVSTSYQDLSTPSQSGSNRFDFIRTQTPRFVTPVLHPTQKTFSFLSFATVFGKISGRNQGLSVTSLATEHESRFCVDFQKGKGRLSFLNLKAAGDSYLEQVCRLVEGGLMLCRAFLPISEDGSVEAPVNVYLSYRKL